MPNARPSDMANRPHSYPVKLSADVVNALLNGEGACIEFTHDEQGKIYIPNREDITFTTRAITADNADTSRAALYSRRANNLRLVGPINHEMEIDRFPNQRSIAPKKRPVSSRNPTKREVKTSDGSEHASAPKPRARKATEKRPRAPPRQPAANATNANNTPAFRIPRSVPAPLAPSLRSAPASPTENGRHSAPKRSAPAARNSMGSLGVRRISPPSSTQLPKPVSRQTPTKARQSPHSSSRGPSPNVHSPSSPRVSSRAKLDDPEDVRRHLVHSLALGDMTMKAIRCRHEARNMDMASPVLDGALGEVAEKTGSTYRLKKRSWREVYDDYTDYNGTEKRMMTQNRFKVGGVDGKLGMEVMNDDLLNNDVSDFVKLIDRSAAESKDVEDDDKLRENYVKGYKLYCELVDRLAVVATKFRRLQDKWVTSGETGKPHVSLLIQSANKAHSERFFRFHRVLPKIHGYLKQVRQAVERHGQQWVA